QQTGAAKLKGGVCSHDRRTKARQARPFRLEKKSRQCRETRGEKSIARSRKERLYSLVPPGLVQPGPAQELDGNPPQVKILCQHGLDIGHVGVLVHRAAEFHYAAEFVAATIVLVGQSKLRVVLDGHD